MDPLTAPTVLDTRPRARGWIHLIAFIITPALAGVMIAVAAFQSGRAALGASIYCASMLLMFGTSALYHRRQWTNRGWQVMRRLDHAMIFVFIAGTYTPFGLVALSGDRRWWVLGLVWGICLTGVAVKLFNPHGGRYLTVPLYLAAGWVAVFVLGDLAVGAGTGAMVLLVIGGLFYTVGAVFYATHWPNPVPGTFGYHEVFHLMTVLAALCQYIAVFFAVTHGAGAA
jgi:hemolysin III